ncbi:gram-negative bacteria binding protein 1 [Chytridium lagenaria]|nr:gram-negative bacteria binding protein 1 [Chytridium lagenaria]
MVFEEDFDTLDLKRWSHDVSMWGGGNDEFQMYVNDRRNSYVRDSVFYIQPTLTSDVIGEERMLNGTYSLYNDDPSLNCTNPLFWGCDKTADGVTAMINPIRSAAVRTTKSLTLRYGKIEVVAQLPRGDFLWPAIWLLPANDTYGGWPRSGEIDVMESVGNNPTALNISGNDRVSSTLHFGPRPGVNGYMATLKYSRLENNQSFADGFHTFGMEWTPERLITYVDSQTNLNITLKDFWKFGNFPPEERNPWTDGCDQAPFDAPFYLIMNVAVGGTFSFENPPYTFGSARAARDFWGAREQWLKTWNGEKAALKIDSVKAWEMC